MDASGMNGATAQAFEAMMQQKQARLLPMKDFMALYQNLEFCVNTCADKFLKHSERVGLRFSEQNAEMMARAQQRR
ncbi:hypothetical protein DMC30DRAFT_416890 [Rhodotorula diobovata]|uniref:Mitochondrial import inner membrane translocase subunit n=1 Tax=Rhodotorula diobovata TaxID=5288 RepID=A0A5C5FXV0_9BASI|nr:hypothetical protein DMC30DRAFT_416890 [Rhodotorula diobovata]